MRVLHFISSVSMATGLGAGSGQGDSLKKKPDSHSTTTMNETTLSLKANMRKLWADHAIWTRQYAVSALDEAPDMVAAKERLLKTPDNIGNSFVPYYGEGTGRKLAELLRKHVLLGVDLIEFAKAGDQKGFETQDSKWTVNADEIAGFLSQTNPHWTKDDMFDLFHQHLTLTKKQVEARLDKRWNDDVAAFDDVFTEINTVADTISQGIMKHFPDKF